MSAQFLWSHLHLILTSKHHHINSFYNKIFLKNYVFIFLRSNNSVLKGGRMPHQKKHYLMILTICFQLLLHAILSWMMINYGVFQKMKRFLNSSFIFQNGRMYAPYNYLEIFCTNLDRIIKVQLRFGQNNIFFR